MRNLPNLPHPKSINRPPTVKTFPSMPTGPRDFAQRFNPELVSGPGAPPDNFVRATTSGDEWVLYWALYRVMEPALDPREPPFYGSKDPSKWVYQNAYAGGRHILGGAVVDFVINPYLDRNSILIRLQTEQWHIFTGTEKHAYDILQKNILGKYGEVYDIFSQNIIADKTGGAAIMAVRDCLSGRLEIDPLLTGQARRVRV